MTEGVRSNRAGFGEWFFHAYRLLWWAGLALMVFINIYQAPRAEWVDRGNATAAVRLALRTPAYAPLNGVLSVSPFGAVGRQLGISEGSHLAGLDGHPLSSDSARRVAEMSGPDGVPIVLDLRHDDGTAYRVRVVRSGSYEKDAFAGSGMSVGTRRLASFLFDLASRLVGLAAAIVLFLRRPRDPVAMVFCVGMLLNAFPVATSSTMWPGLGGVLVVAVAQFSLVLTGLLFPHGRMTTRWHWLALVVAIATLVDAVAENMEYSTNDWWETLTVLSLLTLLGAVIAEYRCTPEGIARQQFKPVAYGTSVWIVFFLVGLAFAFLIEPQYANEGVSAWLKLVEWGCYSLAWMGLPVGLLVALSRFRLYDADSAISASVSYGVVTVSLLAVFGGSEGIVESLGSQYFGANLGALAGGIGAAAAAVMIAPLHARVSRWTERRFRGKLLNLRHGLPLLVGDLREIATPAVLAKAAIDDVSVGMYAKRSAIVIGDDVLDARDVGFDVVEEWRTHWKAALPAQGKLDVDKFDRLFPERVPLRAHGVDMQGWLLIGPRPDGSLHGHAERAALVEIADPVARAFAIARSRQNKTTLLDSLIADLSARLEKLEGNVLANRHPNLARVRGAWLARDQSPP